MSKHQDPSPPLDRATDGAESREGPRDLGVLRGAVIAHLNISPSWSDAVEVLHDDVGGIAVNWSGTELVEPHIVTAALTAMVGSAAGRDITHGWAQRAITEQLAVRLDLSLAHVVAVHVELLNAQVVAASWHCEASISASELHGLLR